MVLTGQAIYWIASFRFENGTVTLCSCLN